MSKLSLKCFHDLLEAKSRFSSKINLLKFGWICKLSKRPITWTKLHLSLSYNQIFAPYIYYQGINHSPSVTRRNYEKSSSTKWDIKLSSESNIVGLIIPGGQNSMNQIPLNLVKIHEGGHWWLVKYIILQLTWAYQPWPSCEVILNNPFMTEASMI